jgi:hypothetical protein
MTTVQVNLLYTLVVALVVFFAGQLLVRRVPESCSASAFRRRWSEVV